MDASMINRRRTSRSAERAVAVEAVSSLDASAWNNTERLRGYTEAAQLHCATAYMSEQYDFSEAYTSILCEFLEVAFHQILFSRSVYPGGFFEKRRKYGISVQMCRHPALNDYIQNVLQGMVPLLNKNLIKKVELVLLGADAQPVERFVFAVSRPDNMSAVQDDDPQLLALEASLKGVLLRIGVSESFLGSSQSPPHDVTAASSDRHAFEVHIHTLQSAATELESTSHFQEFPWVVTDPPEGDTPQVGASPRIVPLKSLKTNFLNMQLFVEQVQRPEKDSEGDSASMEQ